MQCSFIVMKLEDLQRCALELPDAERAQLVTGLLRSLPEGLWEDADGLEEARCRSRQLDDDPSMGCSWDEVKLALGR
jgi:Putative addiction module component